MYISQYVVGAVAVLLIEFIMIVGYALYSNWHSKNGRK